MVVRMAVCAMCEVCDMRVSNVLDKKREKQLVFHHRQKLSAAFADEVQPLAALRLAAQYLSESNAPLIAYMCVNFLLA
jgi:hypothetical protein